MLTTDVIVVFFVAHGNLALGRGQPISFEALPSAKDVRFARGEATHASFDGWAAAEAPERLFVIHARRIAEPRPGLMLVARTAEGCHVYQPETTFPPRTTLRNEDVVAFVEGHEHAALLKKAWLNWNSATKWTDDWPTFARAALERAAADLVDDFPKVLAWTAIPAAVRAQWSASVQAHATPNFGPRYELRFLKVLPSAPIYRDVDAAHASLAKALDAIAAYAATQKLDGWASTFHAARRALDDDASQTASFRQQLGGGNLDPRALRLLDAAWKASVFGGMGSWNDVAPEGDYGSVTSALSDALPLAIEAALNG
jgi:hypothetical protein